MAKLLKKSQKSLKKWTDQDWGYVNKKDKNKPKSKRGRYLPKSVIASLTKKEKAKTNAAKRKANRKGKKYAKYSKSIAKKVRNA
jgi:hypothetical protein